MFYENPDDLRRVQILSTILIEELNRVCKELNISYQAYGGTAIGAVRHNGFIPWDDDVDVSMFREDYEIFLEKAPALLRPDFCIHNGRNNDFFPAVIQLLLLSIIGILFSLHKKFRIPNEKCIYGICFIFAFKDNLYTITSG